MKTFDDWFHELEGHCLRSERFYDSLDAFNSKPALAASLLLWLESAYESGREHMKEEAVITAQQFARKMDAGKEHIVVALENLE